jgi:hypothetical protein
MKRLSDKWEAILNRGKYALNELAILGTVGLVLLTSCATIQYEPRDIPDQVIEWSNEHVYRLETESDIGTGFWVDNTHMVTACHVSTSNNMLAKNRSNTHTTLMKEIFCDSESDLAILKCVDCVDFVISPVELEAQPLEQGSLVYGSGYALASDLWISVGRWQYAVPEGYLVDINTTVGDSGSPVLRIKSGNINVVGVRTASARVGNTVLTYRTLVSGADQILKLIAKSTD